MSDELKLTIGDGLDDGFFKSCAGSKFQGGGWYSITGVAVAVEMVSVDTV